MVEIEWFPALYRLAWAWEKAAVTTTILTLNFLNHRYHPLVLDSLSASAKSSLSMITLIRRMISSAKTMFVQT